jgi:hypothetical protein
MTEAEKQKLIRLFNAAGMVFNELLAAIQEMPTAPQPRREQTLTAVPTPEAS